MAVQQQAKAQSRVAAREYQSRLRRRLRNLPPGALQLLELFQRTPAAPVAEPCGKSVLGSAQLTLAKSPTSRRSIRSIRWSPANASSTNLANPEDSTSDAAGGDGAVPFGDLRSKLALSQAAVHAEGEHGMDFAFTLPRLALSLNMNLRDVQTLKDVFDSIDSDADGELEFHEFEEAVLRICQQLADSVPEERLKKVAELWLDGDENGDGKVDFPEFVRWFSSNGFNEELLLTNEQLKLREIARDMGVSSEYVEGIRYKFEEYVDESGEVDYDAFKKIICKAMRVPMDTGLPETRLRYFWQELDSDGSGRANFREFLIWWTKYFNPSTYGGRTPGIDFFLGFYKGIRSLKAAKLDPPAYSAYTTPGTAELAGVIPGGDEP